MLLVTGGAGFIGSNFVLSTIAETGETVVNLDKLTYAGNLRNLDSLRENRRQPAGRSSIFPIRRAFGDWSAAFGPT